jgi:hypothetical protein
VVFEFCLGVELPGACAGFQTRPKQLFSPQNWRTAPSAYTPRSNRIQIVFKPRSNSIVFKPAHREELVRKLRLRARSTRRTGWLGGGKLTRAEVSEPDVARVISKWTGGRITPPLLFLRAASVGVVGRRVSACSSQGHGSARSTTVTEGFDKAGSAVRNLNRRAGSARVR